MTEARDVGRAEHRAVSQFHLRLPHRAADAFLGVRALALSLGPDVEERVEGGSVRYLRRGVPFLDLGGTKSKLQAFFPGKTALPDPMGRLLRRGDERYVVLDGQDSVDGLIQEFIRRAYSAAR